MGTRAREADDVRKWRFDRVCYVMSSYPSRASMTNDQDRDDFLLCRRHGINHRRSSVITPCRENYKMHFPERDKRSGL